MLDLINLGGNGGGRGNRKDRVPDSGTRPTNVKVPKDNSPEAKSARAFFALLNTLDFSPSVFGLVFAKYSPAVQRMALECLIEIIDIASFRLDNGFCETVEDIEFGMAAKRAQDAMIVFREEGMLP